MAGLWELIETDFKLGIECGHVEKELPSSKKQLSHSSSLNERMLGMLSDVKSSKPTGDGLALLSFAFREESLWATLSEIWRNERNEGHHSIDGTAGVVPIS